VLRPNDVFCAAGLLRGDFQRLDSGNPVLDVIFGRAILSRYLKIILVSDGICVTRRPYKNPKFKGSVLNF